MTAKHIGIIAEDESDVRVLKVLVRKFTTKKFSTSQFTGKGCGPLKRKTPGWCEAFTKKGCQAVVLVHDLDTKNADKLRQQLEALLVGVGMLHKFVVIPVEELEAWLLADFAAVKCAMNLVKLPKAIPHPETIDSPKEHLASIVKSHSKDQKKMYVNTVHNELIANHIDVKKISKTCPSFAYLSQFVAAAIGT